MPDEPVPSPGLEHLRKSFAEVLADLEHPPLGAGVALAEECGEVAKLLLDHHAYGRPLDPAALASELLDVLVCLCEIATLHHVDLDAAARKKLKDLSRRAPEWRKDPAMLASLRRSRSRGSA